MRFLHIIYIVSLLSTCRLSAQICDFVPSKNADFDRYTEGYVQRFLQHGIQPRAVVRIPVVVHVVWNSSFENISDAQIQSQIDALNRDFRKRNTVNPVFSRFAVDCEIEFCLARRDTNDNPTTGIVRKKTDSVNIGSLYFDTSSRKRIYYNTKGGSTAWNPQKYLNIWVCAIHALNGFASSPASAMLRPEEDGIVVDYRVFGTIGSLKTGRQNGRIAVHEVGHYLNLLHIWGSDTTCIDDDEVTDTPLQAYPHEGCPVDLVKSCGNSFDYFRNYMDYTNDDCMSFFTLGQKARMWATLTGFRANLINNNVCEPVGIETVHSPQIDVFPNPVESVLNLTFKNLKANAIKKIQILDFYGRPVFSKQLDLQNTEGGISIPLEHLPNGFYFLKLDIDNQLIIKKIVVN